MTKQVDASVDAGTGRVAAEFVEKRESVLGGEHARLVHRPFLERPTESLVGRHLADVLESSPEIAAELAIPLRDELTKHGWKDRLERASGEELFHMALAETMAVGCSHHHRGPAQPMATPRKPFLGQDVRPRDRISAMFLADHVSAREQEHGGDAGPGIQNGRRHGALAISRARDELRQHSLP
jgi:hypothetical protein